MRFKGLNRTLTLLIALTLALAGFHPRAARGADGDWEERLRAIPQPERIKEYMRRLAAEPHHIGSAAGKRNAEWIRDQFRSWGLKTEIEEFDVLFPTPKERILELVSPEKYQAVLKEPAIAADPDSGDANQLPTYNAYSGDGDVTAQLLGKLVEFHGVLAMVVRRGLRSMHRP